MIARNSVGTVDPGPLIAHVVCRFHVGGLESRVVSLLNRLQATVFRQAVVRWEGRRP